MTQKYDFGTFIGAFLGVVLITTAIVRGGSYEIFLSLNSFFIVVGGTFATTFIAFHYSRIFALFPVIVNAFKPDNHPPIEFISVIISL